MAKRTKKLLQTEEYSDSTDSIRLNRFLSDSGACSRREADRLIEEGHVMVDGVKAEIGMKITKDQTISLNGKPVMREEKLVLIALNKPRGIVCTTDRRDKDNVIDFLKFDKRIYPIGRLDKDSEGLLLLTNDGSIVNKILRGGNYHEKEYVVTVDKPLTAEFLKEMAEGVPILDTITRPCTIKALDKYTFQIILTQGLNRQIRRMCEHLGFRVQTLKRIRIMNIHLGHLQTGGYRNVTEKEIAGLTEAIRDSVNTAETKNDNAKETRYEPKKNDRKVIKRDTRKDSKDEIKKGNKTGYKKGINRDYKKVDKKEDKKEYKKEYKKEDTRGYREDKKDYREDDKKDYRKDDKKGYRREDKKGFRKDDKKDFRREDKKDFRKEDKKDFRREDKKDFRKDDKKDFRREDKKDFRREDKKDYKREDKKEFRKDYKKNFNSKTEDKKDYKASYKSGYKSDEKKVYNKNNYKENVNNSKSTKDSITANSINGNSTFQSGSKKPFKGPKNNTSEYSNSRPVARNHYEKATERKNGSSGRRGSYKPGR
ncbi:MAG: pseudouridine synthase [Anaerocolumna sp.]|jgi:23S rRNA pseudouridine2604 synthase|nr:pseudouridine synthase [Anaerocolumna sp.]